MKTIRVAVTWGADKSSFTVRLKSLGPRRFRPFQFALNAGSDAKEQRVNLIPARGAVVIFTDPLAQGLGVIEFEFLSGQKRAFPLEHNKRRQEISF